MSVHYERFLRRITMSISWELTECAASLAQCKYFMFYPEATCTECDDCRVLILQDTLNNLICFTELFLEAYVGLRATLLNRFF